MYNYDTKRGALVNLKNQTVSDLKTPDYSTPRFSRGETINSKLKNWEAAVVQSFTFFTGPIWISSNDWACHINHMDISEFNPPPENPVLSPQSYIEAGMVKIAVGGSWFNMLLDTDPSKTQYQSKFSQETIPPAIKETYPGPLRSYSSSLYEPLALYRFGYGYRMSNRTSVIAAFLLSLHAVIALVGSLWQLRQGVLLSHGGAFPSMLPCVLAVCLRLRESKTPVRAFRKRRHYSAG
ncbi:hypothetical protein P167DRAFT_412935 [Morchella conica CCBAS932]|uniref:Uncharacterized protein n=1 Tax=Morchella conica CCBAS932 TaxID=1392247 RepID=A0A3N4KYY0_9PEZI|nr:hypothetical protein P167DRAFT_412935 [Morchella conica CCBAS932]